MVASAESSKLHRVCCGVAATTTDGYLFCFIIGQIAPSCIEEESCDCVVVDFSKDPEAHKKISIITRCSKWLFVSERLKCIKERNRRKQQRGPITSKLKALLHRERSLANQCIRYILR
mmetsp:Transcript_15906/g.23444  ORF Transcript_15906/g.23444 Transcript_15906/m.23444 type:complete len:118 (+) Transcript_15906:2367-2720(+)